MNRSLPSPLQSIHEHEETKFTSEVHKTYLNQHGISAQRAPRYHPHLDSAVERVNRLVTDEMRFALAHPRFQHANLERALIDAVRNYILLQRSSEEQTSHHFWHCSPTSPSHLVSFGTKRHRNKTKRHSSKLECRAASLHSTVITVSQPISCDQEQAECRKNSLSGFFI